MKIVRSAILVAAAAMVSLAPTAAHADTYSHTDATADVSSYASGTDNGTPAPDRVEGDVAWNKVRHGSRAVTLTMRYRELSTVDEKVHAYAIHTSKMTRYVYVYAGAGHWGGVVQMTNTHDKKVRCHVTRKIDYTANTASVRIPRSCLGKPRWVKAAMFVGAFPSSTVQFPMYVDDAGTNGAFRNPRWSPRVHR
jgi:hypothetical protein